MSFCQVVPGFRVRIIPVLGTIPAIFGQIMASYTLTNLAGLQVQTEPIVNFDVDHYHILHQRLIEHEETLHGTSMQVQVYEAYSINLLFNYSFLDIKCDILTISRVSFFLKFRTNCILLV